MRRLMVVVALALCAFAPLAHAAGGYGPMGPAPNAGDGVPDGSGFDGSFGPNGPATGNGPMGFPEGAGDGECDCPECELGF